MPPAIYDYVNRILLKYVVMFDFSIDMYLDSNINWSRMGGDITQYSLRAMVVAALGLHIRA